MYSINETNNDQILNEYALRIPKAWAREETDNRPTNPEDVINIPHYELRIEKQIGSYRNRRDTYVYFKLPKSGTYISILIHPDRGVSFDKRFHTALIRETDELDRRIILGFCKMNDESLKRASYEDYEDEHLKSRALCYKASDMPKRIKQGPYSWTLFAEPLKPYEEFANYDNSGELGMFSRVQFLNT